MVGLKKRLQPDFRVRLVRWHERRRKGKLMRYFIKPAEDNRNKLARWLDFYGVLIILMFMTFVVLFNATNHWGKTFLYALPLCGLEAIVAWRIKIKKGMVQSLHKAIWSAGKQALAKIQKIENQHEFETLVFDILHNLSYCQDAHFVQNPGLIGEVKKPGMMRVQCNQVSLVVHCHIPGDTGLTGSEQLKILLSQIETSGLQGGLLVSSGDFSEETKTLALENGKQFSLRLINAAKLVELAREAKHAIFPLDTSEEKPGMPQGETWQQKNRARELLGKQKKKSYYLLVSIVLVGMLVFPLPVFLKIVYLVFAVINLMLYLYCLKITGKKAFLEPLETVKPIKE